ncbi:inner centromere protein A isoform X1 [Bombyx mori]|uniref:Incenp protein n=1 Tax=Bombyx mori TaxID=7091 RepID=L8B4H3_BOMMO|nr:inner centromere protein A [Bombyx mori]XP_037876997.1 inner centromere protein A isoform X1 [Bombyx mori]BAM76725.1 Incenp [Bombyx mori]
MSVFNELLPKICEISKTIRKNFNDDLKVAFERLDKFEEEFQKGRTKAREKIAKDKNQGPILQIINEDEDELVKHPSETNEKPSDKSNTDTTSRSSIESNSDNTQRGSKKRNKNEVDGLFSPEQDKRLKRNASVKAQSIISKQVNVNLTQKLRRENSSAKNDKQNQPKDDDKENEPISNIQIKQEKISLPPESMETESLPSDIEIKQENDFAMPPPVAPVPKLRKAVTKEKSRDEGSSSDEGTQYRTTRNKKQADMMPPPVVPSARSTRASSRATRNIETEDSSADSRTKRTRTKKKASEAVAVELEKNELTHNNSNSRRMRNNETEEAPVEGRPKRTRAKKKASELVAAEPPQNETTQETLPASPAEKPRPKRTRRLQKAAEKDTPKIEESSPELISPKEERLSQPNEIQSPILQKSKIVTANKTNNTEQTIEINNTQDTDAADTHQDGGLTQNGGQEATSQDVLDETKVILAPNATFNLKEMDKTMVLPNGVYNHAPVTPKNVVQMNETVVLERRASQTAPPGKEQNVILDATVVLDKGTKVNMTEDNSLLTDDSDVPETSTPPRQEVPAAQPKSAVKEKVQQFEELASRVTRTKTRAMAKKEERPEDHTPPDRKAKAALSADTLSKMNSMIFNGKLPQVSSSASKPRPVTATSAKPPLPASTSKLSAVSRAREAAEESIRSEKEDARKKKEAMLEAKREMQKRKREEKMAAAAAARSAAELSRARAVQDAARERAQRQALADKERRERVKEVERKKQELARKVAETEERRKAEEQARQQRLAEEQRRAEAARKKQLEEAAAMEKEAAMMAKEIEKRQKEYIEKKKMKQRMEEKMHTPLKMQGTPSHTYPMEPVYMQDGFQYLNSDEDEPSNHGHVPEWSTSKARRLQLYVQTQLSQSHIDKLFSVRVHSPDLREIFPNIDRSRLKRTSSAVWRTPPNRLPAVHE